METLRQLTIRVDPQLTADELFAFYERNNICEVGFGKEGVTRILQHPHVMIAAFDGDELVALARATFDGISAHVMEFSIDLRWQGETRHRNGSLVEADPKGVGLALGRRLLDELGARGCTFVSGYIVSNCEEPFYSSLGFGDNEGHRVVCIDRRPYADGGSRPLDQDVPRRER